MLTLLRDPAAARWVAAGLDGEFGSVGALVPAEFSTVLRLFHPAYAQSTPPHPGAPVRWQEVARWSGRIVHPLMAFERLAVPLSVQTQAPKPWHDSPSWGRLDAPVLRDLVPLLAAHTQTPASCYFGVWEGHGIFGREARRIFDGDTQDANPGHSQASALTDVEQARRLAGVNRAYLIYKGSVEAVHSFLDAPFYTTPNLWWPEDRGWFVATDVDLNSTYIGVGSGLDSSVGSGGNAGLIQTLQTHLRLEVLPILRSATTYFTGDTLNL